MKSILIACSKILSGVLAIGFSVGPNDPIIVIGVALFFLGMVDFLFITAGFVGGDE